MERKITQKKKYFYTLSLLKMSQLSKPFSLNFVQVESTQNPTSELSQDSQNSIQMQLMPISTQASTSAQNVRESTQTNTSTQNVRESEDYSCLVSLIDVRRPLFRKAPPLVS